MKTRNINRIYSVAGSLFLLSVIGWGIHYLLAENKLVQVTSKSHILPEIVVYKSASCTCCHKWVTHLENAGFTVRSHNREDMNRVKAALGVIPGLASCHTAIIDGYLIEGHVPASDIKRLLTEKPRNISGLTAPGMPRFSPGMQASGLKPKGYSVFTFDQFGQTHVFTQY